MITISKANERPATLTERRIQAEYVYDNLYARFKTHVPTDWISPDGVFETFSFPPYSYRFDEFFGFLMTGLKVKESLNMLFPNPDSIDILYIEDLLFMLNKMVDYKKGYYCVKGSDYFILPSSNAHYQKSIAQTYLWLEAKKELLNNSSENVSIKAKAQRNKEADNVDDSLTSKLFLNGFNTNKFTKALIALGLLTETMNHTADSKPRNWRAVIESLRENKLLIYTANTDLFNFIKKKYDYPYEKRSIQNPFNSKNLDTEAIYNRANKWCLANK